MSERVNPTLIGSFVLGALALFVGSVLLLAGNQLFFSQTERFVMYFDGSVKGLSVGSPVMFRGVNIGTVVNMQLVVAENDIDIGIPVVVEIDGSNFVRDNPDAPRNGDDEDDMDVLIKAGLRAQLQLQSLLTGQLFIQVDFYPNTPVSLRKSRLYAKLEEIPTIPTPIEKLARKLENFPFDEVLTGIKSTLEGIDNLVNSPELAASIASLNSALQATRALMSRLDTQVDPVSRNLNGVLVDARGVMRNLNQAIADAQDAAHQAEETLQSVDALLEQDEIVIQLNNALEAITRAAQSVRTLTDSLERHPDMLLRGRQ